MWFFFGLGNIKRCMFFFGSPPKKNNVGQRSPWGHLWKFIKTLHRGLLWDLAWKGPSESWPWIQGFSPFFPVSVMDPNPRNDGRSVVDLKMLTMRNCAKMFLFFKQSWKWKMAIYTCISLSLYIYIWKVTILFGDTIYVSNHDSERKGLRGCHLGFEVATGRRASLSSSRPGVNPHPPCVGGVKKDATFCGCERRYIFSQPNKS